jgi:hypothetical protein
VETLETPILAGIWKDMRPEMEVMFANSLISMRLDRQDKAASLRRNRRQAAVQQVSLPAIHKFFHRYPALEPAER